MTLSRLHEQDTSRVESDESSPISLIERALYCFEQGYYAEAVSLFRWAREQLLPDQLQLVHALDASNRALTSYLYAQQELQEASRQFATYDTEQRVQIEALRQLLSTLTVGSLPQSSTVIQLQRTLEEYSRIRLSQSPPSTARHSEKKQESSMEDRKMLPALHITCFGRFEVRRADPEGHPISLCTNLKGQAIFRYLLTQHKRRETVDKLLAALWPEEPLETAQHKLRVAVSALRCSLNRNSVSEPGGGYILCKDHVYQLNPLVVIQSDVDEFLALYEAGCQSTGNAAAMLYEKACRIYTGPYMAEDLYAEWSSLRREELSKAYVVMCDRLAEFNLQAGYYEEAVKWASATLRVDRCDEEAHQQLIRAYAGLGRRSEALRQFQQCQRVLSEELGVQPMPETLHLFNTLLNGKGSPTGSAESMKWPNKATKEDPQTYGIIGVNEDEGL
jgi:DNA-binding SARP family transcriptional activator